MTESTDHDFKHKLDFFERECAALINKLSLENYFNAPDFVIAAFLRAQVETLKIYTVRNDKWWGHTPRPTTVPLSTPTVEEPVDPSD